MNQSTNSNTVNAIFNQDTALQNTNLQSGSFANAGAQAYNPYGMHKVEQPTTSRPKVRSEISVASNHKDGFPEWKKISDGAWKYEDPSGSHIKVTSKKPIYEGLYQKHQWHDWLDATGRYYMVFYDDAYTCHKWQPTELKDRIFANLSEAVNAKNQLGKGDDKIGNHGLNANWRPSVNGIMSSGTGVSSPSQVASEIAKSADNFIVGACLFVALLVTVGFLVAKNRG